MEFLMLLFIFYYRESVGAGQLEIEVSKVVNLKLVVFTPNTGDNIYTLKTLIMNGRYIYSE